MTALRTIRRVSAMGCELKLAASTKLDLDPHLDGCGVYDRSFVDGLFKLGSTPPRIFALYGVEEFNK